MFWSITKFNKGFVILIGYLSVKLIEKNDKRTEKKIKEKDFFILRAKIKILKRINNQIFLYYYLYKE